MYLHSKINMKGTDKTLVPNGNNIIELNPFKTLYKVSNPNRLVENIKNIIKFAYTPNGL